MRELPVKEIEQAAKDLQLPICQETASRWKPTRHILPGYRWRLLWVAM